VALIVHPSTEPPEGWAAVGLVSPASFCIRALWARLLRVLGSFPLFWGRNESGSGLLTVHAAKTIHRDWLIYSHKSFMPNGLDCFL